MLQPSAFRLHSLWVPFAVVACFLYGLVLVGLIHTTADGSWFWYAQSLQHGLRLYRDLHLPLQPLYPIEVASLQRVFGTQWVAQQSVGLVNLALFLVALTLTTRHNRTRAWQRALLFTCAFVTCMEFIVMRFDDYHVIATSIELLCAVLLLRLAHQRLQLRRMLALAGLGALCGICVLIRINDGGLLLAAVLVSASFIVGSLKRAIEAVIVVPAIAALTVLITIAALGETPHDWWFYTVHTAAQIKGGSGGMWMYPLRLPIGTLHELLDGWRFRALTAYALLTGGVALYLARKRETLSPQRRWAFIITTGVLGIPLALNFVRGNAARVFTAFAVLAIYVVSATVLVRLGLALRGRPARTWRGTELLVLIPLAQLVSISLSAARWYPNTNPSAALFLVLLPVATPWVLARREARAVFFTWVALLTLSAGVDKLRNPFAWYNYRAASFDAPRTWYQHPLYGPMLVEESHLRLVEPVCAAVGAGGPGHGRELLSLPFTFANYFCGVPPWHGYVQTFYDTSSRETIVFLEWELAVHPPEWIVYQRQPEVLRLNEEAFRDGRALPHRELDARILAQVESGNWTARQLPSPPGDSSTWLLIHTR